MAVCIRLDHRCDLDVPANHRADGLIIRGDLCQRYLGPRPVLHAHSLRPPVSERISFSYASVTASHVSRSHTRTTALSAHEPRSSQVIASPSRISAASLS